MRIRLPAWCSGLVLLITLCPVAAFAQTIETVVMPGEVIADHAKYENDCRKCHVPFDKKAQTGLCLDCHKETAADIRSRTRFHGRYPDTTCVTCHTDHKGRRTKITQLDPLTFDHDKTNYPLKGGHQKARANCEGCHLPNVKLRNAPQQCNSCHRRDDVHKGKLGAKCEQCHDLNEWKKTSFDHDKTRFKLELGHKDLTCRKCHTDKVYAETPRECVACHKKDDDDKGHKGQYGKKCESCHMVKVWKDSIFNHDKDTKYALEGKHVKTKCQSCHKEPLYTVTLATTCISCHREDDFQKGHKGTYGEKCENCHTPNNWKEMRFNHDRTKFPLRGKHVRTKCSSCHTGDLYKTKTPTDCIACHRKDDDEKGHRGSLGEKCGNCHNEENWKKETKFDHDKNTDYPLTGKHRDAKCESCHKLGVTAQPGKERVQAPRYCSGCHTDDDQKKGHKGNFGDRCATCHTTKEWKDISFKHDRDTKYKLRGKHADAKCVDCHTGILYREKSPTACFSCHRRDDYQKGHKGSLGTRCEACHNESGWRTETFDHNKSRFPLTGGHIKTECKSCHKSANMKDVPLLCNGCHQKDDAHKRRLGSDCESCHNTRTWKSWDWDHNKTSFHLDGAHLKIECEACHKGPMRKIKGRLAVARECVSCHEKNDVHGGAFGTQCGRCHTTTSWLGTRIR